MIIAFAVESHLHLHSLSNNCSSRLPHTVRAMFKQGHDNNIYDKIPD
jgi:hypothetical protein